MTSKETAIQETTPENITSETEFSFCVGTPWDESNPHSISTYAYGTQVQNGTIADAEQFLEYVNDQTGCENFIYRLVKIERPATIDGALNKPLQIK